MRRAVPVARGAVTLTLYDLQYVSGQLVPVVTLWPRNQTEHRTGLWTFPEHDTGLAGPS